MHDVVSCCNANTYISKTLPELSLNERESQKPLNVLAKTTFSTNVDLAHLTKRSQLYRLVLIYFLIPLLLGDSTEDIKHVERERNRFFLSMLHPLSIIFYSI